MMLTWAVVVVVMVVVADVTANARRQERHASPCINGDPCIDLDSCEALKNISPCILIKGLYCDGDKKKVCCPKSRRTRDVYFGEDAEVGKLPWMAVLGYDSTTHPSWGCGGSLITEQYVLTAAHCVHLTYTDGRVLTVVRLGEHNLKTERDCDSEGTCAPRPQDFTPAQTILHPAFNTRGEVSDDIALIRLDSKANLNTYVRPLSLPPAGASIESLLGPDQEAEVAGWGKTENKISSDILQKASLPHYNKLNCNNLHFNNSLLPEQMCFGGGQQDSCHGDSGSPLVVRGQTNIVVGIVSRGKDIRCGVKGIPAVYTQVASYRNWISQHLRP